MTESQFMERVRRRYPPPEFVSMRQVSNGVGGTIKRYADAVVMATFPSRGVFLIGLEFKDSRSDWKKELDNPQKADEIGRHCAQWWVVTSKPGIIHPGELPPAWGHYMVDGEALKKVNQAPAREALPPTWELLAAILRRAFEASPEAELAAQLNRKFHEGHSEGYKAGQAVEKQAYASYRKSAEQLQADAQAFSEASGHSIQSWNRYLSGGKTHSQQLGEALKLLMSGGLDAQLGKFEYLRTRAAEIALEVANTVVAINNMRELRHAGEHDQRCEAAAPHEDDDAGRLRQGASATGSGD